jgi:FeS assembly SUF system regulator
MIRMSKLTDYGIVLLTHLARGEDGSVQTAQELSRSSRVPLPTVSKILKALSKAGLLFSHRGRRGGYGLARPARDVSVAEVIAALEGPIGLTECSTAPEGGCSLEAFCQARGRWGPISRAIERALQGVTLSAFQHEDPGPQPSSLSAGATP